MKKIASVIMITFLMQSCSFEQKRSNNLGVELKSGIKETIVNNTGNTYSISNAPCFEFQKLANELNSLNWIPDTNRLVKSTIYKELDRKSVVYFNRYPFYKIKFDDSRLNKSYYQKSLNSNFDSSDFELFKDVDNIWAYFYKDKNAKELITDGVVEQWEFKSEQKAKEALIKIKKIGESIYFNTMPYFSRIENKLFIFQTRAMKFSFRQKDVFEKFEEIIKTNPI